MAVLFHEEGPPAALAERADTRIMPQEEVEAKRLPWLGVEVDALDEGVAELLGVSAPTRDGARGLQVVAVHAGSPAERSGIAPRDILLSVQRLEPAGEPPVDLRDAASRDNYFPGMFGGDESPAPWRPRANGLVKLLRDWGTGTPYELVWWHAGEERRARLAVEIAPPDFDSAPRCFDEPAGIEVRDLTYEVRHVLRLRPADVGVVVARTEEGSPAAQARIRANELVLEMDGRPVPDAKTFGEMLKAAREEGKKQVRLVVRRLGKTRIVDLRAEDLGERSEPKAPGDEGAGEGEAPGETPDDEPGPDEPPPGPDEGGGE